MPACTSCPGRHIAVAKYHGARGARSSGVLIVRTVRYRFGIGIAGGYRVYFKVSLQQTSRFVNCVTEINFIREGVPHGENHRLLHGERNAVELPWARPIFRAGDYPDVNAALALDHQAHVPSRLDRLSCDNQLRFQGATCVKPLY